MKNICWYSHTTVISLASVFCFLLISCMVPAQSLPENLLLDYKRSGDFAGRTQHLQIFMGSSATLEENQVQTEFIIPQEEIETLIALLQIADFQNIQS